MIAAAAAAAAVAVAGCSSARVSTTSTTPAPGTLAPPDTAATTTSTAVPVAPSSPASSPEDAAAALTSAWSSGDRARASRVATAGAVITLFTLPYPRDNLQFRSCSNGSPSTCTYRNTGSATGEIYELVAVQVAKGWYVQAVRDET